MGVPVHEGISTKDHSEELGGVLCHTVSIQRLLHVNEIPTKPLTGDSTVFSKLVILFPQTLIAEHLVGFANLDMWVSPALRKYCGRPTYGLEFLVGCRIARVLVYTVLVLSESSVGVVCVTRVQLDGEFAVSLLDFEFGGCRRDLQSIVVGSIGNHGCRGSAVQDASKEDEVGGGAIRSEAAGSSSSNNSTRMVDFPNMWPCSRKQATLATSPNLIRLCPASPPIVSATSQYVQYHSSTPLTLHTTYGVERQVVGAHFSHS